MRSDNAHGLRQETWSSGTGLVIQFSLEHMRRLLAVRNFQNKGWFMISEDRFTFATQLTIFVAIVDNTILAVMLKFS